MKIIKPICLALILLCSVLASGQDSNGLYDVTLYSVVGYQLDWTRSSVEFDSGIRGPATNAAGTSEFDLTYGALIINDKVDWFGVVNPRSRIIDLGAKNWTDFRETPSLWPGNKPRKPLPLNAPMVADASAGVKEPSPYQQYVPVVVDHMYLMQVVRGRNKTYVMFRVKSLVSKDNCILSWKKVAPPKEDLEK